MPTDSAVFSTQSSNCINKYSPDLGGDIVDVANSTVLTQAPLSQYNSENKIATDRNNISWLHSAVPEFQNISISANKIERVLIADKQSPDDPAIRGRHKRLASL